LSPYFSFPVSFLNFLVYRGCRTFVWSLLIEHEHSDSGGEESSFKGVSAKEDSAGLKRPSYWREGWWRDFKPNWTSRSASKPTRTVLATSYYWCWCVRWWCHWIVTHSVCRGTFSFSLLNFEVFFCVEKLLYLLSFPIPF